MFDDSVQHEVVYSGLDCASARSRTTPTGKERTAPLRVVLIVDLWHPALSGPEKAAIAALFPPFRNDKGATSVA